MNYCIVKQKLNILKIYEYEVFANTLSGDISYFIS